MNQNLPVVGISGATGWLGRSAVMALIETFGDGILQNVHLFGRQATKIRLSSGVELPVRDSYEISRLKLDIYVPLAFSTREKYFILGEKLYRSSNIEIIERDCDVIKSNPNCRVILISSGVVNGLSGTQIEDPSYVEYGILKKVQEEAYQNVVSHSGQLKICRLYSITSEDLIKVEGYALASMVSDALKNNLIRIASKGPVIRRYVDFRQLFYALLHDTSTEIINSAGELVEIRNLAQLIVKTLLSTSKIEASPIDFSVPSNEYVSPDNSMDVLFSKLGITPLSLPEQIKKTAIGVKNLSL